MEVSKDDEKTKLGLLRSYGKELIAAAKERKLELSKPTRYSGKGYIMTLACTDIGSIIPENFSLSEIMNKLQQYQTLLDDFVSKHKE